MHRGLRNGPIKRDESPTIEYRQSQQINVCNLFVPSDEIRIED